MCSVNLGLAGVYKYKSSQKDHLSKSCCGGVQGLVLVTSGISHCRVCILGEGRVEGYVRELELSMTFKHKLHTCRQANIQPHALSRRPRGCVEGMRSKGLVFYGSCYPQLP